MFECVAYVLATREGRRVGDLRELFKKPSVEELALCLIRWIEVATPKLLDDLATDVSTIEIKLCWRPPFQGGLLAREWRRALSQLAEVVSIIPEERPCGVAPGGQGDAVPDASPMPLYEAGQTDGPGAHDLKGE